MIELPGGVENEGETGRVSKPGTYDRTGAIDRASSKETKERNRSWAYSGPGLLSLSLSLAMSRLYRRSYIIPCDDYLASGISKLSPTEGLDVPLQ